MLLQQYLRGDSCHVWQQLRQMGEGACTHPEAIAVARETMKRVRSNIEVLVSRLEKVGYRFQNGQPHFAPATSRDKELIHEIEDIAGGPMPLSLKMFYEEVGSVNLCQSLDQLVQWFPEDRRDKASELETLGEEDPLYVLPASELHADLLIAAKTSKKCGRYSHFGRREGGEERWYCFFAPDEFHKANYSGGENYNLFIPDPSADFRIFDLYSGASEDDREWFVDYLRLTFEGGGFRGKANVDDCHKVPPTSDLIKNLCQDLLPI